MTFHGFKSWRGSAPFLVAAAALLPCGGASASAARTIWVPADHPTIQGAVDAAADGDTVRVAAGSYSESVVIRDRARLRLEGDASARIDADAGEPSILVSGGSAVTVTGFTLASDTDALRFDAAALAVVNAVHVTSAGGDGIRISAISGEVTVTANRVDGAAGTGIRVEVSSNVRADVTISRNVVSATGGDGIFAFSEEDRSALRIHENQVGGTGGHGIRTDCGYAYIETNVVSDTALDAISVYRSRSEGVVRFNTIRNAGGDGVSFVGTPSADVESNDIRGTVGDGIDVAAPAVNILDNTIRDTGGAGVRTTEVEARDLPVGTYNESIADNRIESSGGAEIEITDGIGIDVRLNVVTDAGTSGIQVSGDDLSVHENSVVRPAGNGLSIENLGGVGGIKVVDNDVTAAGVDGVDIGESDGVVVARNRVDGAGACGFRIGDGAQRNVFRRNVASDCGTFGLMVSDLAGRNRIVKNNRFGAVHGHRRRRG